MKRPRGSHDAASAVAPCGGPAHSAVPQQSLREKGEKDFLVLNSPYGGQQERNGRYGWGNLFQSPRSAALPHLPNIRIGVSSLNAVPGTKDRGMQTLLAQYRRKFCCLEHCYPYHNVGEPSAWASWMSMVQDSNQSTSRATPSSLSGTASTLRRRTEEEGDTADAQATVVQANRFLYTIKANKYLTHERLAALDADTEAHIDLFFTQRCRLLEPNLGPILLQFPPYFLCSPVHLQRLEALANRLPQDEVVYRVATPAGNKAGEAAARRKRIRVAVEFRHRSWYNPSTFALLRRVGWGLVVAHHHDDPTFSVPVDTEVDFLYVRLHGPLGKNTGDYGPEALSLWAERVVSFVKAPGNHEGSAAVDPCKEVFVFLNNSDSHVGGTTSSTVDATCLAEHIARLLPPPPQAVATSHEELNIDGRSPQSSLVEGSGSSLELQQQQPPPPPPPRQQPRVEETESVLDVDSASCGTIVID